MSARHSHAGRRSAAPPPRLPAAAIPAAIRRPCPHRRRTRPCARRTTTPARMSPPLWRSRAPDEVRAVRLMRRRSSRRGRSPAGGGFPTTPSAHDGWRTHCRVSRDRGGGPAGLPHAPTVAPCGYLVRDTRRFPSTSRAEARPARVQDAGSCSALRIAHRCAITRHWRFGASLRLSLGAPRWRLPMRAHFDSFWAGRPRRVP